MGERESMVGRRGKEKERKKKQTAGEGSSFYSFLRSEKTSAHSTSNRQVRFACFVPLHRLRPAAAAGIPVLLELPQQDALHTTYLHALNRRVHPPALVLLHPCLCSPVFIATSPWIIVYSKMRGPAATWQGVAACARDIATIKGLLYDRHTGKDTNRAFFFYFRPDKMHH